MLSKLLPTSFVLFTGATEAVVILLVAVVLLYGRRAPEVAGKAGRAVGSYKKAKQDAQSQVEPVRKQLNEDIEDVREDLSIEGKDPRRQKEDNVQSGGSNTDSGFIFDKELKERGENTKQVQTISSDD